MKKLITIAFAATALISCDTKGSNPSNSTKADDTLAEAKISAGAKKEAEASITAENVESEAEKLLKEIESDNE